MEITVLRPGALTTVQDLGRPGLRAAGVTAGGAADRFALRLANLLVGNPEEAAGLEMTLQGAELEFGEAAWVVITGGEPGGASMNRPQRIGAGERLRLGRMKTGCRAYLAVAGGLVAPRVLGGCGTDLRGGFGGHEGRALRAGDVLHTRRVERKIRGHWRVDPAILPAYSDQPVVRVVAGPQAGEFEGTLAGREFIVGPESDRMGLRLQGEPLRPRRSLELLSSVVVPGTVQVPPAGGPIVLLADAQTLGGYPQIAHVVTADLPLLAQLRPGDRVRFEEVTLADALRLRREQERNLAMLREGLRAKMK